MSKHNHGTTSNTPDCFRTFIGCRVKGMLRDRDGYMLVFECGWALAFNTLHGSYWVESSEEVKIKLRESEQILRNLQEETKNILALAGEGQ